MSNIKEVVGVPLYELGPILALYRTVLSWNPSHFNLDFASSYYPRFIIWTRTLLLESFRRFVCMREVICRINQLKA
jgi:hypothetical protein